MKVRSTATAGAWLRYGDAGYESNWWMASMACRGRACVFDAGIGQARVGGGFIKSAIKAADAAAATDQRIAATARG